MRRTLVVVGGALAALAVFSGSAAADDCVNFSRPANGATPWETTRGRWTLISTNEVGTVWAFDTPDGYLDHNSKGDALLDMARCPTGRLTAQLQGELDASGLKGIWSEGCFIKASGG